VRKSVLLLLRRGRGAEVGGGRGGQRARNKRRRRVGFGDCNTEQNRNRTRSAFRIEVTGGNEYGSREREVKGRSSSERPCPEKEVKHPS